MTIIVTDRNDIINGYSIIISVTLLYSNDQ